MPAIWRRVQSLVARAEESASLQRLDPMSRRGFVWGGLEAGVVGLVLGIVLGAISSGIVGALVGALLGLVLGAPLGAVCGAVIAALALQTGPPPEITFELDHPEAVYAPGERITGLLRIAAPARANLLSGQVSLLCRGMFAHEQVRQTEPPRLALIRDTHVCTSQADEIVPPSVLRRRRTLSLPFSFRIADDAPPTHRGYICAIVWTLHARLELRDRADVTAIAEITVRGHPASLERRRRQFVSINANSAVQLSLQLPEVVVAEGQVVHANLRIRPLERLEADEVRAVLLRIEHTPSGETGDLVYVADWNLDDGTFKGKREPGRKGTTYVWLEDEIALLGKTTFLPDRVANHEVQFTIPEKYRPTFRMPGGRVSWRIAAVIHRNGGGDLQTSHELFVHTSAPELSVVIQDAAPYAGIGGRVDKDSPPEDFPPSARPEPNTQL
jgi:hypothetical protein